MGIPSCNVQKEAKRAAIYRYFDEVVDQGKSEVVRELFSPDARQHFLPCLEMEGWEEIMGYVGLSSLLGQSFHTTIHEIIVEGDTGYAHVTHTMKIVDEWPGPPAPPVIPLRLGGAPIGGQTVQWDAMARFKFNDANLITEEWILRDELSMVLQAKDVCAYETACLCGATCHDFPALE